MRETVPELFAWRLLLLPDGLYQHELPREGRAGRFDDSVLDKHVGFSKTFTLTESQCGDAETCCPNYERPFPGSIPVVLCCCKTPFTVSGGTKVHLFAVQALCDSFGLEKCLSTRHI